VLHGANKLFKSMFEKIAHKYDDLHFGVFDNEAITKESGSKLNSIHLTNSEGISTSYSLENWTTAEDVEHWLSFDAYPILREIDPELFDLLVLSKHPFSVVFLNEEHKEEWLPKLTEWAQHFKGKMHLVWAITKLYGAVLPRLGASGQVIPTVIAFPSGDKRPLAWDESVPITKEGVLAWLEDAIKGSAKGFRKSQPPPETNDGPVKIAVGSTFEQIANDHTKDVLMEIYAEWCGHCQELAPIYEELGRAFENVESVVIAKIDGSENGYTESINIPGFPSLLFFRADDKQNPIHYDGDRSLQDLKNFVKTHASIPFELEEDGGDVASQSTESKNEASTKDEL